jgi:UDP:flavonoid glycosyltransferase YjiC (YdhE family)
VLIIPLGSDNPVHARRCVSLGLGQSIAPSAVTEYGVRQAVYQLMTERRWRREAERRQEEIARLPSLQRGVDLLVRLALTRQPVWSEV